MTGQRDLMKRQCYFLLLLLLFAPPSSVLAQISAAPTTIIDDFEDASRDQKPPHRSNLWGGVWNTTGTGGSSIAVSFTAPGHDSTRSIGARGFTNSVGDWAILQTPLTDWKVPYNAKCHGLLGVQFWLKGDGKKYRIEAMSMAVTDNNYYGDVVRSSEDDWQFFQIAFSDMARTSGWGSQSDLPQNPDGSDFTGFQIFPLDHGDFAYSVDQVSFYGNYVPICPGTPVALQQVAATPTKIPWKPRNEASDTPTPGGGEKATPTPIHYYCPPKLLDDFEDPGRNGPSPNRTNLWGGSWSATSSLNMKMGVDLNRPGAEGSAHSMEVTGQTDRSKNEGFASVKTTLHPDGSPYDLLKEGFNAIQFSLKGDGNSCWLDILTEGEAGEEVYSYMMTVAKGDWSLLRVSFKSLNRMDMSGDKQGVSLFKDWSAVTAIQFRSQNNAAFDFGVDQIAFYCDSAIALPPHPPKRVFPTKTPTPPPIPTSTKTFIPTKIPTSSFLIPNFTSTPTRTSTPYLPPATPTWTPRPPVPTPTLRVKLLPTPTRVWKPVPTPTRWYPTRTWTPLPLKKPQITDSSFPIPHSIPSPVPTWFPPLDTSQAITFLAPPANIYMVFADGPGLYQLKVVNARGVFVKNIYDQRIVAQKDDWVYWDGKDGEGKDMPPGQYFVLLFKDGKALKSISIIRSGQ